MKKTLLAACLIAPIVSVLGAAVMWDYLSGRPTYSDRVILQTLRSAVLDEAREVIVRLPESYGREPQRRYPVIYVLDGSSEDIHTADSAALMARIGVMPELIVVGIPNVSGAGRPRDYTPPFMVQDIDQSRSPMGEADRFLLFLKTELIPSIEGHYRTQPFRMLAGHSRGGLLVVYSLLADPPLFGARFAHSPALWRDNGLLNTKLKEFLRANTALENFLYLSMGSEEVDKMLAAYDEARAILAEAKGSGLRWRADLVAGADHGNNGAMATPLGFKAFYQDWSASDGTAMEQK